MSAGPPCGAEPLAPPALNADQMLAETRAWVVRAVIGLNLCPFAKAPQVKGLVRYVLTEAADTGALLAALRAELTLLAEADPESVETTLLVHPRVLADFDDYNDFLDLADAAVGALGLEAVVQLASFHPRYRFAGTKSDDLGNATNRSPYPTLHLLREQSVTRAVDAFAEPERIVEANLRTLESIGPHGWADVQAQCRRDALCPELAEGHELPRSLAVEHIGLAPRDSSDVNGIDQQHR